jgi:streptogramin lyase
MASAHPLPHVSAPPPKLDYSGLFNRWQMLPAHVRRTIFALFSALALAVLAQAPANAAEPTVYELPEATHAASLTPAADGSVWLVPARGTEWSGEQGPAVARLAADGTFSEYPLHGFGAIGNIALGPQDEIWISGESGAFRKEIFEIGRLSPTGELLRRYVVGRGDGPYRSFVSSLSVSAKAVWFVRQRSSGVQSIERLDPNTGAIRQFFLRPRCRATALQPAPGGTLWFTEKCGDYMSHGPSTPTEANIGRIESSGKIIRRSIVAADYPVALTLGPEGTVWFGALRRYNQPSQVGRLTNAGKLAEFPVPNGSPGSIAVGPNGRLWFQSSFGGWQYRAINSIGFGGRIGKPRCADPTCALEPTVLTAASDGSLWYGLRGQNLNTGGGGSGIAIEMEIANEAGSVGHLLP